MTLADYLLWTAVGTLVYNLIGFALFEARHDGAVLRSEKLMLRNLDPETAADVAHTVYDNSREWHRFDNYFVAWNYGFIILLQIAVFLLLGGNLAQSAIYLLASIAIHAASRWPAHDGGIVYWWLGLDHLWIFTPTREEPGDFWDGLSASIQRKGVPHILAQVAVLILSYVLFYVSARVILIL